MNECSNCGKSTHLHEYKLCVSCRNKYYRIIRAEKVRKSALDAYHRKKKDPAWLKNRRAVTAKLVREKYKNDPVYREKKKKKDRQRYWKKKAEKAVKA